MIKMSLILLMGLAVARLLKNQSAATRHWILAVVIGCAAAAPVLERVVPAWGLRPSAAVEHVRASDQVMAIRTEPPQASTATTVSSRPVANSVRGSVAPRVLTQIWIVGAFANVLLLVVGFGRLRWLAARSERIHEGKWAELANEIRAEYGIRRSVTLLQSPHPTLLVTWGVVAPKVILPAIGHTWSEDRIRVVLAHEIAHINRGDWLAQILAEVLRAVYWFNPIAWLATRRLREESERACDDAVLRRGVGAAEYATHLLSLAREARRHRTSMFTGFPAPAMARHGSLERRVSAMLNDRLNRGSASRRARACAACGLLAISILIGGFGAAAQTLSTFSGSVVDPMNKELPGATVLLINLGNDARHQVRSDEAGRFEFVGVSPGDYALEASFMGFTKLTANLTVSAGTHVERVLSLKLGSLAESVHVRGGASDSPRELQRLKLSGSVVRVPAACTPSATGGNIRAPRKLTHVNPRYPAHLWSDRVQGTVMLAAAIGKDGSVQEIEVLGTPHPDLAEAAIEAVRQWEFGPTLLNCEPVEVAMKVVVHFSAAQ